MSFLFYEECPCYISKTTLSLRIALGNINNLTILILPMCEHDAFPFFFVFPSIYFIHVLSFLWFSSLTCLATFLLVKFLLSFVVKKTFRNENPFLNPISDISLCVRNNTTECWFCNLQLATLT